MLGGALVLWAPIAQGQNTAAAEALFDKGVEEMQAGRYATGCPALEESYRLDPMPGALYALAECDMKWGKLATAVARYQDYLGVVWRLEGRARTRHEQRAAEVREEIARLAPQVPKLTLVLPKDAPAGTVVKRNGVELKGASLGTALPVDPGEHVVSVQAPGGKEQEIRVKVEPGDRKRVELVAEMPRQPEEPLRPAPVIQQKPSSGDAPEAPEKPDRTLAWVFGGVGAAGVAVGSVTGVLVLGRKNKVTEECDGAACTAEGKAAADSGRDLAMVSNVGFAVGVAGVVTAVALVLTEPNVRSVEQARGWKPVVVAGGQGAWLGAQASW